jgi:DHA1 family multidrug resistance protein-like MFS transporter
LSFRPVKPMLIIGSSSKKPEAGEGLGPALSEAVAETPGGAVPEQGAGAADGITAPQWQRTLWAMVGIQFIMTMAFSVLSPIMPLLLPELGLETESAVDLWAGILNGVTSFVAAFASPVWGRVADRHGRKLMLLRSSLAIGVFTALMGAAANVWQFFAFRALMGVFAGFSSAAIALVASQVPEGRLGYALGWLNTGQLVGSLVGPLIGGALADLTGSYRIPFYCTSATILLSMGSVWIAVDKRFAAPQKRAAADPSLAA